MVREETKLPHKCLGAQDSQISYNVLHIKGKGCNISSHPHGQHDSPVILHENEGYQKSGVDCDQQRNLGIPFETKYHDFYQGFQRMETKPNHLHEIVSDKGNTRDGSVCFEGVTQITPVHVLEN